MFGCDVHTERTNVLRSLGKIINHLARDCNTISYILHIISLINHCKKSH